MNWLRVTSVAVLLCAAPACVLRERSTIADGATAPPMSELWAEPSEGRDLFWGPGGPDAAPDPEAAYQFVARDVTGRSGGYDVRDAQGRLWSVKLGPEARPEVVVSRLMWAAGYFQPATYYLPSWTLAGTSDPNPQPPGRFRLEAEGETRIGRWAWNANPFVGTAPLRGLFVLMVMVNNWDLKTQQNVRYELTGGGATPVRRYVVRDVGASLGGTRWLLAGSKGNLDDFEREGFIHSVRTNHVRFHYRGGWRRPHLTRGVTPADVRWMSERLARLSASQWSDAFRAAGYSETESQRYVVKLQQKVAEGLAITGGA